MRLCLSVAVLFALGAVASAQDVGALIEQASQPVGVDLAVGITVNSEAAAALTEAGLAGAIPPRMAIVSLRTPRALEGRVAAERQLAALGTSVVPQLVEAEAGAPVGLWIPSAAGADNGRIQAEIRGLNLERVLLAMGPDVLPALESAGASGQSELARRAAALHDMLGELDVTILPGGVIRVEGEETDLAGLPAQVRRHGLARSARVTAPGDLPLNQMMPVLDALRDAGLEIEIQATSSAVVTITSQGGGADAQN